MSAHTPGPWRYSHGIFNSPDHSPEQVGSIESERWTIAAVEGDYDGWEDNARLLAAAPDLLAACEAAGRLAMLALQSQRYENDAEYRCATDAVLEYRELVAKAQAK